MNFNLRNNMKNKDQGLKAKVGRMKRLIEKGYVLDIKGRLVHRLVCYQAHGPFPRDWVVHHIDEDKTNNTPENLIAMPKPLHDSIHKCMRRDRRQWTRQEVQQAINAWRGLRPRSNVPVSIVITRPVDQSLK